AGRFAIAWDLPVVEFGAGRRWWKRYTRTWGRSGGRAVDLAGHALIEAPAWRRAIEAWQAPYLDDPARPDWYVMALFNELYFLVDGGSFWEGGEVGGAEPGPGDVGRFALLECVDYAFYDTVDVDFYASFALLELFPELELRGIRDLLATIPIEDPEMVTILASVARAPRKVGGTAMVRRLGLTEAATHWEQWFERGQVAFDRRLWRRDDYAYDGGDGPSSESIMADQLAGQWYADATGLGDVLPPERVEATLRT